MQNTPVNIESTTATQAAFAKLKGWHPSYVSKLKQAGRLIFTLDGKVNVKASEALIADTADPARNDVVARNARKRAEKGRPDNPIYPPDSDSYSKSRAVKEHYNALAAKLEYELANGQVVDVATVRQAGAEAGLALRSALENLPDQLAPLLAPITDEDEMRRMLDDQIEIVLTQIADKFQRKAA